MRRQARALSAGSIFGRGSRSGVSFRGALASRGVSAESKGSGVRAAKGIAASAAIIAIFSLALCAAGASAAEPTGASCPNQAFRNGPSAALPDCRAYEMVSPVDKKGSDIITRCDVRCNRTSLMQATADGSKLSYSAFRAFGDSRSSLYSNQYIATRGAGGWSTHSINPPRVETLYSGFPNFVEFFYDLDIQARGLSADLSTMAWTDGSRPALTPDAVEEVPNFYARNNLNDTYDWIAELGDVSEGSDPGFPWLPEVLNLSHNGDHIVFMTPRQLTDDATASGGQLLYDFTGGEVHLVSVLPDGTPVGDATAGRYGGGNETQSRQFVRNALSADGRRITWSTSTTIYQRIDNSLTIPVSEITGPGAATYDGASTDGTEVLYRQTGGGVENLYRVNVDDESSTVVAEVSGGSLGVVGASDDLSRVYFVSSEVLAAGATAGEPNLYLSNQGSTELVATLAQTDLSNTSELNEQGKPDVSNYTLLQGSPDRQAARVTPDGLGLAFQSVASLTGYDNRDIKNNERDVEVFVYDAASDQLTCASCNPSGARPNGKPAIKYNSGENSPVGPDDEQRRWTAAFLQTAENQTYYPRDLSDDGNRVFFNAYDALTLEDNNNQQDVYQWEAQGTGSCTSAGGCISLISTGESPVRSEFVDASASGGDVFFSTASSLSPQDPGLIDIYNAKENGGFEALPPGEAPCEGDACQALPTPPNDPTPASGSYNGPGNVQEKAKKKHRKKHHKRHHGKHGKKRQKSKAAARAGSAGHATHRNG